MPTPPAERALPAMPAETMPTTAGSDPASGSPLASALVRGLAVTRLVIGGVSFAVPRAAGVLIPAATERASGTDLIVRSFAAREVALGIGALEAVQRGGKVRPWCFAAALADGGDAVATVLSWRSLRRPWRAAMLVAALAATGVDIALAVTSTRQAHRVPRITRR